MCTNVYYAANKRQNLSLDWLDKQGAAHFAAHGLHVGKGVGCPWAAHGNFAIKIRLPTTSMYWDSGQLSGLSTTFIYGYSGQLSLQLSWKPTTFKYGNGGQPLNCPLLNLKWKPSLIHMQDICSTCVYNTCYSSWSQISIHNTNRMNILHFEYFTIWYSYIQTYKMTCFNTSFILYNGNCGVRAN